MPKFKPCELAAEARRRNLDQLANLGGQLRGARERRRWTQLQLAERAGISRSALSDVENGRGGGNTLDTWQRLALASGRPLVVRLKRDPLEDVADAGHLAMQELVLRLGRVAGFISSFELATRPAEPWRSTDVGLRDDRRRMLVLCECWNAFGDVGAAARSTTRKLHEAESLAVAIWGEAPHQVASVWIVRDTIRNRELTRRYPEVFRSRFPGSSAAWVRALTVARRAVTVVQDMEADMPDVPFEPGLVWCDVHATRLFAWRQRSTGNEVSPTTIRG
jgi:transcriptional regulator with XRE-family HTH domain